MKVLFMGTPDFAVGILEAIIKSDHEVVCVVTQEDKPKGRSDRPVAPPVKECALSNGIEVFQPHRIKDEEAVSRLREYDADIFVVAAYGQILSKEILDMPRFGCINTHASLLPLYRGAAPIQWAIADGLDKTGVTVMQMDEGLDTGDILYTKEVDITQKETGESLFNKLMFAGAELITEALDRIDRGDVNPVKQDASKATYARILNKKMGALDFAKEACAIERLIRAFTPWPGTYTYINGKILKILEAEVADEAEVAGICTGYDTDVKTGSVAGISKDSFFIRTGRDYLKVSAVLPEGKKRMACSEFLKGSRLKVGDLLG